MKKHDILVTGGSGFLGSHLVERLVQARNNVVVIDDLSSGRMVNLKKVIDQIEFIKADLRDREFVMNIVKDVDLVYHLGANASVPRSVQDPVYDFECNSLGTFNVLEACRRADVDRVVYASSAAVYGEPEYTPIDENHPLHPISPYGASKLAGEKMGFAYHKVYGLRFLALRIFNVYGTRQKKYVMYDFIRKLIKKPRSLKVLGNGEQTRTFCYISDAIDTFLLVARQTHGVFNVGGNLPIKIKDLAELFVSKLSPHTLIQYTGTSWRGDIQTLVPDISKTEKLGFKPTITLDQGIEKLIASYNLENILET